jgi:hypothetical protein
MNARPKHDSVDLYNDVAPEERTWKVRMPNGATRTMTIEELDAAFDKAEIGLTTLVQRPSGGEWRTLGEAAGVDDSIRPVSSDFELIDIPKPPPLPRMATETKLSEEELATVARPRRSGRRLAAVAMIGLLVGGVVAWRYMPAKPMTALATTTIMAPHSPAAAAAAPPPAAGAALPSAPETAPAPEGNALAEQTVLGSMPNAVKTAKPVKSTAKPKAKTTWKQRLKLHAKAKKHA